MATQRYRLAPGLKTEHLGQEFLVCDTDRALVHRISGPTAEVLRCLLGGGVDPIALDDDDLTRALLGTGVIVSAEAAESWVLSRRRVFGAGAAVGTVGITTLVPPRAAVASSESETLDSATTTTAATTTTSTTVAPPTTLPARPTSDPTTRINNSTGLLEAYWEGTPAAFQYTYEITDTFQDELPEFIDGTLNPGTTFSALYTLPKDKQLTVTFTSQTNPEVVTDPLDFGPVAEPTTTSLSS